MKKDDISEREKILLERIARRIVDMELEGPAIWILQTIKPLSVIGGELAYFYLAPFLPLLDEKGYEFIDTFEKRENIERLIKMMEKISKDKGQKKRNYNLREILNKIRMLFVKSKNI
ncbi:MAG: hypothetical protein QXD04_02875 [Candidatus Bathyarchaeia archaeon]|nr:hypothetical protein [Candidatus Bathyarchaeota archaeon]